MTSSQSWTDADVGAPGSRPGFYINFVEQAQAAVVPGARGTVGIISEASWGPDNEIVELTSLSQARALFTNEESSSARLYNLIRLAFRGGAATVKAARVLASDAVKSTLTLDDTNSDAVIRVDAKYKGSYGNNISVEVTEDPVVAARIRVRVFVAGALVHSVTSTVDNGATGFIDNVVALFAELNSPWVDVVKIADGEDDLDAIVETNLASGTNGGAPTTGDFGDILDLFSANRANILTTDSVTTAVQAAIAEWILEQRSSNYYIMATLGSDLDDSVADMIAAANDFNHPAIVYVGPGAVLPNVAGAATTYSGATVASMVAGLIAGTPTGQSITFAGLPGSSGVEQLLSNTEVRSLLANGVCAITSSPPGLTPSARVEKGITTLYDPGDEHLTVMKRIRTVRITDGIAEGLSDAANLNFIGRQLDNEAGRTAILGAIRDFLRSQANSQLIQDNFAVELDEERSTGDGNLFLNIGIQPINAVEYIWTTISLG